jgi:conjugal transfer pilus assembly protein TraB
MSKFTDSLKSKRRLYLIGVGAFILLAVLAYVMQKTKPKPLPKPKPVFTSKVNEKNLLYKEWITKNGVTVHHQTKELKAQNKELEKLKAELNNIKKNKSKPGPQFGTPAGKYPPAPNFNGGAAFFHGPNGQNLNSGVKYSDTKSMIVQESYTVPASTAGTDATAGQANTAATKLPPAPAVNAKKPAHENKIPAGSFVKAVLLTGADIPTSSTGGTTGPLPVIFRITSLAQLPNSFKSNIKSCFVVGEATGSLASQRAYIKVTHLSCVTKKRQVISKGISGMVSGVDGNVGLSGKVVSKQGSMLARVLVAGFLQGVGQAFQTSQTNIMTSPLGSTQAVAPNTHTLLSYGVGGGVSQATQKLSSFYMKLANQMFPVIVIHAGRPVNIIFLQDVNLP